jgi:PKD repeat protein
VPSELEHNTKYYWFVVAKDDHGNQSVSPTWSFTTRPEILACSALASVTIGPPPLAVAFSGGGREGLPPYTYLWVFGDSATSTAQNPVHIYNDPGTFGAIFKVMDSDSTTCSQALAITVEGPPACSALAVPAVGPPPLTVSLMGMADGGKLPYTFLWDFGDGTTGTDQNSSHVYAHPGDFFATFQVTGADNRSCQFPVAITVGPLLSCDASGSPVSGPLPLTVHFSGFASGGRGPYSFFWSFGDGGSSAGQFPSHTYTRSGPFTAVLSVSDAGSSSCSHSMRIVAGS